MESDLLGDPTPPVLYNQVFDTSFVSWKNVSIAVPIALDPTKHILVVCLQSEIETANRSVSIDNIEFCTNRMVSTAQPISLQRIRIFPNPNAGDFSVELPEPASLGMNFRITDLTGGLVFEQKTEPGSTQQTVQVGALPNGLYLLQVVSDGKVLAVEKFVKQ